MQTRRIEFDFNTYMNLIVDGVQIDDAEVNVLVSARVEIHDTRDTGGIEKEVVIDQLDLEYTAAIDEVFCLETFGHNQNVFEVHRKQILNHPDMQECIQEYVNENY
jgi:hypothetical protein